MHTFWLFAEWLVLSVFAFGLIMGVFDLALKLWVWLSEKDDANDN